MTTKEYNKCVDLYSDRVYRFIIKNIGHEADAADIVQNAFEILWKKRDKVELAKARSYLFSVAYHNMIDQLRKGQRMTYVDNLAEQKMTTQTHLQVELQDWIQHGLQQLSEVQRSVVLLRDYEGYNYQEIGEVLNLSTSQVKVYIFRARKKLKQFLVTAEKHEL